MRLLQLAFVLRLVADRVESRVDRIGIACLQSMIGSEVSKQTVVAAQILIEPAGDQPFCR